jgi:hypothetical protein
VTVIVVSFFESVFADHSKDHPVAVAHLGSDTLTGTHTPLCWTPLRSGVSQVRHGVAPGSCVDRFDLPGTPAGSGTFDRMSWVMSYEAPPASSDVPVYGRSETAAWLTLLDMETQVLDADWQQ